MLNYATNISNDSIKTLQTYSDLETILISVEFCVDFEKIEPEEMYTNFYKEEENMVNLPKTAIPCEFAPQIRQGYKVITKGKVIFDGVSARYPSKAKNVVTRLRFSVAPGEKIGVVGRTGAGKTSLLKLLIS